MKNLLLLGALSLTATLCVADHILDNNHRKLGAKRYDFESVRIEPTYQEEVVVETPVREKTYVREPYRYSTDYHHHRPRGPIGATAQGVVEGAEAIVEAPLNLLP